MWHFVNSICSAGPAEECSAECFSDMFRSAPSNWKSTLEKSYCSDNKMESSHGSPSGTTSAPSTASRGGERSMSFVEVSPARTSAQQEKVSDLPENGQGFGLRWPELSARYDRATSSWKIHPCLFPEDSMSCSVTLPRWGMMQGGVLSVRKMPELHTVESDAGLWQTLVADDAVDRKNGKINSRGEPKLSAQVMLPTLTVKGNHNRKGLTPTSGDGLATALKRLPTLAVQDAKSNLVGGPLNPTWCEWFMGFPLGWTALKVLEMRNFRQWQHSHGEYLEDK